MPEYVAIRVRRETARLLERKLRELEDRLGRRLDYDELLRILVRRSAARPELLRALVENPVPGYSSEEAQGLLRRERARDTRF